MAPHSNTLAWKISWTEEPGRLQSMESLRVGHDWVTSLSLFTCMHWRGKWQPIPVFLPGDSQARGSLVGCRPWGRTVLDTTEATQQVSFPALYFLVTLLSLSDMAAIWLHFYCLSFFLECKLYDGRDFWLPWLQHIEHHLVLKRCLVNIWISECMIQLDGHPNVICIAFQKGWINQWFEALGFCLLT